MNTRSRRSLKIFSVMAAAGVSALPFVSSAADFRAGRQPAVAAEERIGGNLFTAGGSASLAGPVAGDVSAAGGTLALSGAIGGDANVAGGNIAVTSAVAGDMRAVGGSVTVQGSVGGDLLVGGGDVRVSASRVGGDAAIAGGSVRIESPIGGNLRIAGGDIYLNAPVAGNADIKANTLTLGGKAVIHGNLKYTAQKEAALEPGAQVLGATEYRPQARERAALAAGIGALLSLWFIGKFLALLAGALLIAHFFRRFAERLAADANARPLPEIGRGLLAAAAFPATSVLLMITLIGIPFGVFGFLVFFASLIFTWMAAPIVAGALIWRVASREKTPVVSWQSIFVGAFAYTLLELIPIIGWIARLLLFLLAFGAALKIKWDALQQWRIARERTPAAPERA